MRISRSVSAAGEPDPFSEDLEVEDFLNPGLDTTPEAQRPRLDQQPLTEARRVNGRPVILEDCQRCRSVHVECVDDGAEVLCLSRCQAGAK
jgi:hypothetical protein